ncbi:MAG: DUF4132 domain-containing protein [Propionibacteriaceae bacterium]|nr:DUF4132 domain-containing protein [Propionibacteriaceae bacterium]
MHWTPTGTGHEVTIRDGAIVARNGKGKELATVPAAVKKTEVYDDLDALLSFLHSHDAAAGAEVEHWLLRSLPVPRAVLAEVWADEAWRSWLTDLVVATEDGQLAGFLRAADATGLGIVDLDGESVTIDAERVMIPHPALIAELDDLREFAVELGITQRFNQLFREVHPRPVPAPAPEVIQLNQWANAEFEQLRFVAGRATSAGFKVSGGYATATIYEDGRQVVARYWIGAGAPEESGLSADLHWISDDQTLPVAEVGPVAYSEGVRMASYLYAGRTVKKEGEQ